MTWNPVPRPVIRTLLRRSAVLYARHGWNVLPGAYLAGDKFDCGTTSCPTIKCHPAHDDLGAQLRPTADPDMITTWWHRSPFNVLLPTGLGFDVIEVPAYLGALAARILGEHGPRAPISVAPSGRWMLFVAEGEALRPELDRQMDIVLHGRGSWVPAPPSRYPAGRVRWEVSPGTVNWALPGSYPVQHALVDALQLAAPRQAA
ncbi:bifunctional DNA primase/polymerase [Longispora sp. K20-0274]|uniref:bifunctional DNA primase/polymerase n=1 Tax=Longispora sp. K20-0274 TaxID=3088255 RepID=UPI00399C426C